MLENVFHLCIIHVATQLLSKHMQYTVQQERYLLVNIKIVNFKKENRDPEKIPKQGEDSDSESL